MSGVDLARVVLHTARGAAKARGERAGARKAKRRGRTMMRRDGREPQGFAAVLEWLMADRAWDVPAVGGRILDQRPSIAAAVWPQLPEHLQAVAFPVEEGRLDLRPDSLTYATQLRLDHVVAAVGADEASGMDNRCRRAGRWSPRCANDRRAGPGLTCPRCRPLPGKYGEGTGPTFATLIDIGCHACEAARQSPIPCAEGSADWERR